MPQTIHTLLIQYLSEIQKIYGAHLKSVILYGSYARGDYTPDSDIDIMILVDLSVEEMDAYSDALSERYMDDACSEKSAAFLPLGSVLSILF